MTMRARERREVRGVGRGEARRTAKSPHEGVTRVGEGELSGKELEEAQKVVGVSVKEGVV